MLRSWSKLRPLTPADDLDICRDVRETQSTVLAGAAAKGFAAQGQHVPSARFHHATNNTGRGGAQGRPRAEP